MIFDINFMASKQIERFDGKKCFIWLSFYILSNFMENFTLIFFVFPITMLCSLLWTKNVFYINIELFICVTIS
jgi:hypothetical protein